MARRWASVCRESVISIVTADCFHLEILTAPAAKKTPPLRPESFEAAAQLMVFDGLVFFSAFVGFRPTTAP